MVLRKKLRQFFMFSKRMVLKNSFYYVFSTILINAIGFLLLPIVTKYLTPEDYGTINLVYGFTQISVYLVAFSLYSAVLRFYGDMKEKESLRRFIGTILIFIFLMSILLVSAATLFEDLFIRYIFNNISFFPIIFTGLISLLFTAQMTLHQTILQSMQKGKKLAVINIFVFLALISLKMLLIIHYRMGALGVLLAQLITYMIYFIYMIYDLWSSQMITFAVDLKILRKALVYSIPIIPHNISTLIASLFARIFINNTHTLASVGLYGVAFQLGGVIDIIQTSVNRALQPWIFDKLRNNQHGSGDILSLTEMLLIMYTFVYMLLGLFSQEIVILMTAKPYHEAWKIIPILVIGFSIKSIYYFYINIIMYTQELTRKLFIATMAGSLSDIILAYILIKQLDRYGAALSFMLAKIIVVAIVVYISRRHNTVGYSVLKMLRIIVPSIVLMFVGLYYSYTTYQYEITLFNVGYKILILLIYLVSIYILYYRTYREAIMDLIKSRGV
jgi:O-antigen/teichoic acid export membrane protein